MNILHFIRHLLHTRIPRCSHESIKCNTVEWIALLVVAAQQQQALVGCWRTERSRCSARCVYYACALLKAAAGLYTVRYSIKWWSRFSLRHYLWMDRACKHCCVLPVRQYLSQILWHYMAKGSVVNSVHSAPPGAHPDPPAGLCSLINFQSWGGNAMGTSAAAAGKGGYDRAPSQV